MRVFDDHCDTVYQCYRRGKGLFGKNPDGHWDLERIQAFSSYAQFFAIFEDPKGKSEADLADSFAKQCHIFRNEIAKNQNRMTFCRSAPEGKAAFKQGKVAAFLSVEGADLLGCSLSKLEEAYRLGVRVVNLTWNRANKLSGSHQEETHRGLSSLGVAFVWRMQELGMLVDVSHLSDPGFWDVLSTVKKPVIASHSNARAVFDHTRNVTDSQFYAMIRNGGVVGLNLYSGFLGMEADMDTIVSHLDHFWSLGGEDHVSIGADWDGCDALPKGMQQGVGSLADLYEHLLQKNYGEILLDKLFYKNMMRVVGEVCIT